MLAPASRVASASNWLATLVYAYAAFIAAMRPVTIAVRWAAALTGASVAYVLVMLLLAAFWRHDSAHAAIGCAGGMAVSVLCGARAATTVLLPQHRAAGVWVCTILGMLYPVFLAAGSAPNAPVRAMQFTYIAMAAVGGVAALWTLPLMRGATISRSAHAWQ